jgi:glutamate synthase (NADPH/NADH) small chain
MEEEAIVFKCNTNVGEDVSMSNLLREYQAVVMAGGSTIPRNLDIPGRELKGVYFAMQFLKQQNKRVSGSPIAEEEIMATDKNVIVIGGGDTGSDCVGTSNRHKAKSVTQFELLPKPPVQRNEVMPWPSFPMLLKTTSSHEEGCDRKWAVSTKEFIGDEKGHLKAVIMVDLEWKIVDNKPAQFVEVKGSERKIPCDLAFLAMGFNHPQHEGMIVDLEIELDERGNVRATEKNYQSNIARVFTAGDMRRGQSLVVWAIKEGRDCAQKVDEFLMGQSLLETADRNSIARYL